MTDTTGSPKEPRPCTACGKYYQDFFATAFVVKTVFSPLVEKFDLCPDCLKQTMNVLHNQPQERPVLNWQVPISCPRCGFGETILGVCAPIHHQQERPAVVALEQIAAFDVSVYDGAKCRFCGWNAERREHAPDCPFGIAQRALAAYRKKEGKP